MMSELIVEMNMPKDCYDCPMYHFASCRGKLTLCCNAHLDLKQIPNNGNPRPSWCPIIGELPEQHGRLIDADDVNNHIIGYVDLRDCPTIVPATERSET